MTAARPFFCLLIALAVALWCPGCVCVIPDSFTLSYKRQRNLTTGRPDREEIGASATYHLPK